MKNRKLDDLSRRERQIMDSVYRRGKATVAEVRGDLPDPPSPNAVRRLMSILVEKGLLTPRWKGRSQVYEPVIDRGQALGSALDHLKRTFFDGNAAEAMAALLDHSAGELSDQDLAEIEGLLRKARRQGR